MSLEFASSAFVLATSLRSLLDKGGKFGRLLTAILSLRHSSTICRPDMFEVSGCYLRRQVDNSHTTSHDIIGFVTGSTSPMCLNRATLSFVCRYGLAKLGLPLTCLLGSLSDLGSCVCMGRKGLLRSVLSPVYIFPISFRRPLLFTGLASIFHVRLFIYISYQPQHHLKGEGGAPRSPPPLCLSLMISL